MHVNKWTYLFLKIFRPNMYLHVCINVRSSKRLDYFLRDLLMQIFTRFQIVNLLMYIRHTYVKS